MSDTTAFLEQLLGYEPHLDFVSLAIIALGVIAGVITYLLTFRIFLRQAVKDAVPPSRFRLTCAALAAMIIAIALFVSGWGFLWTLISIVAALVLAAMGKSRWTFLVNLLLLVALIALVFLGLRNEISGG